MGIQTVRVLRTISKIILLIVGIGIIGYGGLMVYKSVINKPQRVRITNVTDSAATITWVTDNPVRGVVYYKDEGSFLPGPLGLFGSKIAYDDRDFALAQDECVRAFNENAKNTKDANFTVDGSNFDCENISVEKLGAYYTHSVTIKNLNESSTYFFVVGNGIWSWSVDGVDKDISENDIAVTNSFNFKTGKLLEEVPTPNIAYGTVVAKLKYSDGEGEAYYEDLSKDSLVFSYLEINEQKSQIISSVTNASGGWIFDKSNFRDADGNLITDLTKARMMVCAQYEDVETRGCVEALGDLGVDTELELMGNRESDLTEVEKNTIREKFEMLVAKVYAENPYPVCKNCSCTYDGATYTSGGSEGTSGCKVPYSSAVGKCKGTKDGYAIEKWFSLVDWSNELPSWCSSGSTDEAICAGKVVKIDNICSQSNPGGCSAPAGAGAGHIQKIKDKIASCNTNGGGGDDPCSGIEHDECNSARTRKCVKDDEGKWHLVNVMYPDTQCPTSGGTTTKCTDKDGKKYSVGEYCPLFKGKCLSIGKCVGDTSVDSCTEPNTCTRNSVTGKYEICKNGTIQNCSAPEQDCTVKAKYSGGLYDAENQCLNFVLTGCELTCRVNGGSAETSSTSKARCMALYPSIKEKVCEDYNYQGNDTDVDINEIDLGALSPTKLKEFLKESQELRTLANKKVDTLLSSLPSYLNGENCNARGYKDAKAEAKKFCDALDGSWKVGSKIGKCTSIGAVCFTCDNQAIYNFTCEDRITTKLQPLLSRIYAADGSDGYTLYLPEYGMYSFELGDYELTKSTTGGDTYYIFYIEANDKAGFQMPEDPDNPTADEDIMLKSSSAAITYEKVSSAQSYTIVKGINLVSFNFIPVSTELGPLTAQGVIKEAAKKNVEIQYISAFEGGRWAKGYTCKNDKCSGNDFNIIPGKGYLVYATTGGEMTIPGYNLKSSVPVNLSGGWNLVGIHGYTNAYTAASLIESINKIDGITANNVTWWPTSKGMYEGLQVTGTQQYGLDFPISPTNGYFVRISSFKPEESECKSILWNEGGTLNGACGVTK